MLRKAALQSYMTHIYCYQDSLWNCIHKSIIQDCWDVQYFNQSINFSHTYLTVLKEFYNQDIICNILRSFNGLKSLNYGQLILSAIRRQPAHYIKYSKRNFDRTYCNLGVKELLNLSQRIEEVYLVEAKGASQIMNQLMNQYVVNEKFNGKLQLDFFQKNLRCQNSTDTKFPSAIININSSA
ncbi:unnamed protein product [Paramecium octaurelia]|uniref:Uncharacterized protein n=1 Tax=Paramecium octaurelia TaxID=43137 RepID=A0A8S1YLB7_PAROT|nr:unnamed protein product [Paramecium octaurelia]